MNPIEVNMNLEHQLHWLYLRAGISKGFAFLCVPWCPWSLVIDPALRGVAINPKINESLYRLVY